ncbi:hypothetical protein KOW79_016664 [Hemibagrus wyckioides]|uniref:Uncharacterized protein n=1 Tax=Hemibagrus wyckioides TaxID=337641 RepID=A0A9D3SCL6_9TELE|nr:hypothetical protein KOW79_016664 [Hemibagrus wyckioides]
MAHKQEEKWIQATVEGSKAKRHHYRFLQAGQQLACRCLLEHHVVEVQCTLDVVGEETKTEDQKHQADQSHVTLSLASPDLQNVSDHKGVANQYHFPTNHKDPDSPAQQASPSTSLAVLEPDSTCQHHVAAQAKSCQKEDAAIHADVEQEGGETTSEAQM